MTDGDSKPEGWLDPLRRSSDSLLGLVQSRLELFTVELQEEKLRAINLLIWLTIALGLGVAGLLVVVAVLAIFLWNVAGYFGLLGLAVGALGGAAGLFYWLRRKLQTGPTPFHTTVAEFKKDRECLRKKS